MRKVLCQLAPKRRFISIETVEHQAISRPRISGRRSRLPGLVREGASVIDPYWALIDFANGILTGTMLGGSYALISIGLALNFGVMRLVNLSHGDWLIVAAYLCVTLLTAFPVSPFAALIVVVPIMFGIGYVLQRGLPQSHLGTGNRA